MTTTIPDLWSPDIRVDILTPLAILRMQAGYFDKRTQRMLQAEVHTTAADDRLLHRLDLVAPALDYYRKTLLTAEHRRDEAYPVIVTSEALVPTEKKPRVARVDLSHVVEAITGAPKEDPSRREAHTQEDFVEVVRLVLQSGAVLTLIQSLIARINEAVELSDQAPPIGPADNGGAPETQNHGS